MGIQSTPMVILDPLPRHIVISLGQLDVTSIRGVHGAGRGGFSPFLAPPRTYAGWKFPTRKLHLIKIAHAARITAGQGEYFEWHLRNFDFIL